MSLVPVAAGSRLIAPGRLFARLPQDLSPFAYEVTSHTSASAFLNFVSTAAMPVAVQRADAFRVRRSSSGALCTGSSGAQPLAEYLSEMSTCWKTDWRQLPVP